MNTTARRVRAVRTGGGAVRGFCPSGGCSHRTGLSVAQGFPPRDRIADGIAVGIGISGGISGGMRAARVAAPPYGTIHG